MYLILIVLLILVSCNSVKPHQLNKPKVSDSSSSPDSYLSEIELERLEKYKSLDVNFYIDEIMEIEKGTELYNLLPETMAYEGMRLISLLELYKTLSIEEQYEFIKALFMNIPVNIEACKPIRNIVIPKYFNNGEPLIVHVTTALTGNGHPSIVALYNASKLIRKMGAEFVKGMSPEVQYPGIFEINGKKVIYAGGSYTYAILNDNRVSASSAVDKELPKLTAVGDVLEKLNLIDAYLRDGTIDNDVEVPILNDIITKEDIEPAYLLFAKLQLFIANLFRKDYENARKLVIELMESPLLKDEKVAGGDLENAIRYEIPSIYRIALALAKKDKSYLTKKL